MLRAVAVVIALVGLMVGGLPCHAERAAPTLFEVQINGESFTVEANRQTKLESKAKPGARYDVAVRIAPTQHLSLNTLQFEYDLPAKVEIDGPRENRSARLTHELGFSVILGDLGRPLDSKGQAETLQNLLKSVTTTLREAKMEDIDVTEPHERKFDGASARGATVRYHDGKKFGHVCLVYVLTGPKFAATCVAEYLDHDADDAIPLIKKILDSVRPIASRR
jgi:hypothetical protein